jgi:hypothetical protein
MRQQDGRGDRQKDGKSLKDNESHRGDRLGRDLRHRRKMPAEQAGGTDGARHGA